MNVFLVRMLAASLWRNIYHCAFQQLEQALLYSLTAHIAGDRRIVALAGNLVYLVNKHDTFFCSSHIIVSHLEQTAQNAFHIFAHITSLGKYRSINNSERHIQQFGDCTGKKRLSRSGAAHHDDVALFDFHTSVVYFLLQTLIVIIHRHGKRALGTILSDDILIQILLDLYWLRHLLQCELLVLLIVENARRQHDIICLPGTILADKALDACYQQFHFALASSAKATHILWHYSSTPFLRVNTASIIPYSLASSAVIQ